MGVAGEMHGFADSHKGDFGECVIPIILCNVDNNNKDLFWERKILIQEIDSREK